MISAAKEKKLLQIIVGIACIVPVLAGLNGMIEGVMLLGNSNINVDSHFRYLSGLLLGIGIGFLTTIPRIEKRSSRFKLLTMIVVAGGAGRLLGFVLTGAPGRDMCLALIMELAVTPLLWVWQRRVAQRFKR